MGWSLCPTNLFLSIYQKNIILLKILWRFTCVFFYSDNLQGQEEKIIFISTVLTRPESLKRAQAGGGPEQNIGFLSNAKRFNVAITRAKVVNQTFNTFHFSHFLRLVYIEKVPSCLARFVCWNNYIASHSPR